MRESGFYQSLFAIGGLLKMNDSSTYFSVVVSQGLKKSDTLLYQILPFVVGSIKEHFDKFQILVSILGFPISNL